MKSRPYLMNSSCISMDRYDDNDNGTAIEEDVEQKQEQRKKKNHKRNTDIRRQWL